MRILIKQSIYIVICSIILGMTFNYFSANGIPVVAKQRNTNNYDGNEVTTGFISLEMAQKFFDDNILFIDARDTDSYNGGHIAGAIKSMPFSELIDYIFTFQGFDEPLVVYCDDEECGLSENLAYQIESEGFSIIYIFSGGWKLWESANLPTEK